MLQIIVSAVSKSRNGQSPTTMKLPTKCQKVRDSIKYNSYINEGKIKIIVLIALLFCEALFKSINMRSIIIIIQ